MHKMRSIRPGNLLLPCLILLLPALVAPVRGDQSPQRKLLNQAKAEAVTIPAQAEALAGFAWPAGGPTDPVLHAMARDELVNFGTYGIPAIRAAITRVDRLYTGDVTAALIEAARTISYGQPQDLLPGLEEAIWYGSIEARRLAMIEISRRDFPPAVLPIIDAVHDDPELSLTAIRALGRMGNRRARFFLADVLREGSPRHQRPAADALLRLGDPGIFFLRRSVESTRSGEREAAMLALLPAFSTDDLTLLHEYYTRHADDDPAVLQSVRERAMELEALLEEQFDEEDTGGESP